MVSIDLAAPAYLGAAHGGVRLCCVAAAVVAMPMTTQSQWIGRLINVILAQAMENSTKNSSEMLEKLTLMYNRTRQAKVTTELNEIISGALSLEDSG